MDTVETIMLELEKMGTEQTRKTFLRHGAPSSMFGVKVGDLKTIVKRVKKNHTLAKGLYDTGNSDAMYLAGLIGDETKMTKSDLNKWAKNSTWHMISEYTVPFVAAESPYAMELALEWIGSSKENIASAGWATLSLYISISPNETIDKKQIKGLMAQVAKEIHNAHNRVRYTMNGFILSVGAYIPDLTEDAKKIASKIGDVYVNMGDTACKVPAVIPYLEKMEKMNKIGQKRKNARC
jgi:3-methyladenine DNA glycosylase AlkD